MHYPDSRESAASVQNQALHLPSFEIWGKAFLNLSFLKFKMGSYWSYFLGLLRTVCAQRYGEHLAQCLALRTMAFLFAC